jgi:hypothetical protein
MVTIRQGLKDDGVSVNGSAVPLVRGAASVDVLPTDEGAGEGEGGAGRTDQGNDRGRAVVRLPHGGEPPGSGRMNDGRRTCVACGAARTVGWSSRW